MHLCTVIRTLSGQALPWCTDSLRFFAYISCSTQSSLSTADYLLNWWHKTRRGHNRPRRTHHQLLQLYTWSRIFRQPCCVHSLMWPLEIIVERIWLPQVIVCCWNRSLLCREWAFLYFCFWCSLQSCGLIQSPICRRSFSRLETFLSAIFQIDGLRGVLVEPLPNRRFIRWPVSTSLTLTDAIHIRRPREISSFPRPTTTRMLEI